MPRLLTFALAFLAATSCTAPPRVHVEPGQEILYECVMLTRRESSAAERRLGSSEQRFPSRLLLTVDRVAGGTTYFDVSRMEDGSTRTAEPFRWSVDGEGRFKDSEGMRFADIGHSFAPHQMGDSADGQWRNYWPSLLDLAPVGDFGTGGPRRLVVMFVPARLTARLEWTVEPGDDEAWNLRATGKVVEWDDKVNGTTMSRDAVRGRARVSKQDGLLLMAELTFEIYTEGPGDTTTAGTLNVSVTRGAR